MTTHDTPVPAALPTGAVTPSAWWFLAPIGVVAVGMLVAVTIMMAATTKTTMKIFLSVKDLLPLTRSALKLQSIHMRLNPSR